MDKILLPPKKLQLSENLKENLRKFKQQFEFYILHLELKTKQRMLNVPHCYMSSVRMLLKSSTHSSGMKKETIQRMIKKMEKVLGKYEKYCGTKSNLTYERHQFNTRNQNECESIDSYMTNLRIFVKIM